MALRLHVFGASGSGTSTLGQRVAQVLDLPWLDVDDYYWAPTDPPYTQKRPIPERLAAMNAVLDDDLGWVVSGSLCSWGAPLAARFTQAVFLYVHPSVRLPRLAAREQQEFGARVAPGGDMYATHLEFMAWAARYDTADDSMRSLTMHEAWLATLPCPVLRLNSQHPPAALTEATLRQLAPNAN